jgi:alpha-mannosidase
MYTFHLLANAHLDPVWLWDWREGLNEGITTCRTILDLMDEDGEMTFLRGEAAVYAHIERHDPETFRRIAAYVEAGRWDVVGGTWVQPDTNLPATETFARHFARGGHYFATRFGVRPRIAWAADSFGHAAGLPDILTAAGMEGYAFTRPGGKQVPLAKPAFWWEGAGGGRVLAYRPPAGWYGSERDEMPKRLDAFLSAAQGAGLENVGVFFGVGNHGGGPTRRQIADVRRWAEAHAGEVRLVWSGLHRFFDALRAEAADKSADFLPTHRGELNFVLRGCYSSVARFKFLYRKAEALISRAETTATAITAAGITESAAADLGDAWETLLFNSFHDILPGTSIERAYDDQTAQLGGAIHAAQRAETDALLALARRVDTSVPVPEGDRPSAVPFLVWNPHPEPFVGHVEFEACLDYRPVWEYVDRPEALPVVLRGPDGEPVPFQNVATEHMFSPHLPWRRRVVAQVGVFPLGWSVYTLGWEEGGIAPPKRRIEATPASAPAAGAITNGTYSVRTAVGDSGITVEREGRSLLPGGDGLLSLITVEDPWGSWGGMGEEPESLELSTLRERWTVQRVETLESGPERASLWVRLAGGRSWCDLTFRLYAGRDAVDVDARVLWNERAARLKLVMPVGAGSATFDVPGGQVERSAPTGEVPGGRWVEAGSVGFASDALYNFDLTGDGTLRATICRATRYAAERPEGADDAPWRPAVDAGELRFRFLLTGNRPLRGDNPLRNLSCELERPLVVLPVSPSPGDLPRNGSLPNPNSTLTSLLAFKPAEDGDGFIVRLQNESYIPLPIILPGWITADRQLPDRGLISPHAILTWRLTRDEAGAWTARPTTIQET